MPRWVRPGHSSWLYSLPHIALFFFLEGIRGNFLRSARNFIPRFCLLDSDGQLIRKWCFSVSTKVFFPRFSLLKMPFERYFSRQIRSVCCAGLRWMMEDVFEVVNPTMNVTDLWSCERNIVRIFTPEPKGYFLGSSLDQSTFSKRWRALPKEKSSQNQRPRWLSSLLTI